MSIETNDAGLLKAIGRVIIPGEYVAPPNQQPVSYIGLGVRSLVAPYAGAVEVELVEAVALAEFHAVATYADVNVHNTAFSPFVEWLDDTHFRVTATGAIEDGEPVTVYLAIRRVTPAAITGTNNLLPPA
jgi:hypothetical protein